MKLSASALDLGKKPIVFQVRTQVGAGAGGIKVFVCSVSPVLVASQFHECKT